MSKPNDTPLPSTPETPSERDWTEDRERLARLLEDAALWPKTTDSRDVRLPDGICDDLRRASQLLRMLELRAPTPAPENSSPREAVEVPDLRVTETFTPEQLEAAIDAAEAEANRIIWNHENGKPRKTIPVGRDDSDVLIIGALAAARAEIARLRTELAQSHADAERFRTLAQYMGYGREVYIGTRHTRWELTLKGEWQSLADAIDALRTPEETQNG